MKNKNFKKIGISILALVMSMALFAGCAGQNTATADASEITSSGTLLLSVNPAIAISYDEKGNVTKVEARNDDGSAILKDFSDYKGKSTRQVMTDLVNAIGKAGYFVEEIEGKNRKINIEIESGSRLPYDAFLDEMIKDIRKSIKTNQWRSPLVVKGSRNYGFSDYIDTDYGRDNDGFTDYSDYGKNKGNTDYDDTDYGPNNDGKTDYSDYGKNKSNTDYDDTDYGPNNDGKTDYTDYDDTDYDDTDYDDTDYDD